MSAADRRYCWKCSWYVCSAHVFPLSSSSANRLGHRHRLGTNKPMCSFYCKLCTKLMLNLQVMTVIKLPMQSCIWGKLICCFNKAKGTKLSSQAYVWARCFNTELSQCTTFQWQWEIYFKLPWWKTKQILKISRWYPTNHSWQVMALCWELSS